MKNLKTEFNQYLSKMGISGVLLEKVRFMYEVASNIFPEEIEQIFVEDSINSEGIRIYESLYFFSKNYIGEARGFSKGESSFAIFPMNIQLSVIELKEYDFVKASDKSRLEMKMYIPVQNLAYMFTAAKENCDVLRDIIIKYIKPKL